MKIGCQSGCDLLLADVAHPQLRNPLAVRHSAHSREDHDLQQRTRIRLPRNLQASYVQQIGSSGFRNRRWICAAARCGWRECHPSLGKGSQFRAVRARHGYFETQPWLPTAVRQSGRKTFEAVRLTLRRFGVNKAVKQTLRRSGV